MVGLLEVIRRELFSNGKNKPMHSSSSPDPPMSSALGRKTGYLLDCARQSPAHGSLSKKR